MASPIKNVALVGATGNLGTPVLHQFLSSKAFNLTVLTRSSSKHTLPAGVNVIQTDYSASSLQAAFQGQDAVISIVGAGGFGAQQTIVDAAIAAGVRRFIPSEYGCNTADARTRALVPIFEGKRKVVDHLMGREKDISWTALATGPFADWGLRTGFLGFDLKNRSATLYDKGTVPFSASTLAQIGRALVRVLLQPEQTANRYVYVSSVTTTQRDILAALEKATGATWSVKEVAVSKVIEESSEKVKKGDFSGIGGLIQASVFGDFEDGPYCDWRKVPGGDWTEKLGLHEESLDSIVKSVL